MGNSEKIRVMIADDHPLYREGIKSVLSNSPEYIALEGEAENGEEAYYLAIKLTPDVIILDIDMPVMNGLEAAKKILEEIPKQKIILLTMHKAEDLFNEAINVGVSAYVLKENAVREVLEAVKTVATGEFYVSSSISSFIINRSKKNADFKSENPGLQTLTDKEKEIVKYISAGLTSREIAEKLFISYKTVENHRANICKKINVQGVHSLMKFAIDNKHLLGC